MAHDHCWLHSRPFWPLATTFIFIFSSLCLSICLPSHSIHRFYDSFSSHGHTLRPLFMKSIHQCHSIIKNNVFSSPNKEKIRMKCWRTTMFYMHYRGVTSKGNTSCTCHLCNYHRAHRQFVTLVKMCPTPFINFILEVINPVIKNFKTNT